MAGHVVDGKAGDAVAFFEATRDGGSFTGPDDIADDFPGGILADEGGFSFGTIGILLMDEEGRVVGFADVVGAALMIGMGMGEKHRGDGAALELAAHVDPIPAGGGIDDYGFIFALDVIGVEGVGPEELKLVDVGGDLFHRTPRRALIFNMIGLSFRFKKSPLWNSPQIADNRIMDFSMSSLLSGLLVGFIGTGFFMYGKKESRFMPMMAGGAMFIYPWFITSSLILWIVTIAICVFLFVVREKD